MLEHSFGLLKEASCVWRALEKVFEDGFTTAELSSSKAGRKVLGTMEFGQLVVKISWSLVKAVSEGTLYDKVFGLHAVAKLPTGSTSCS